MRQILLFLSLWTLVLYGDIHQAVDIDGNTIYVNDEGMVTDSNGNIIYLDEENIAIDNKDNIDINEISYDNVIYDEPMEHEKMFSNQKIFSGHQEERTERSRKGVYTINTPYYNVVSEVNNSNAKEELNIIVEKVELKNGKIENPIETPQNKEKEAVAIKKIKEWWGEITDYMAGIDIIDIVTIFVSLFILFSFISLVRSD